MLLLLCRAGRQFLVQRGERAGGRADQEDTGISQRDANQISWENGHGSGAPSGQGTDTNSGEAHARFLSTVLCADWSFFSRVC